MEMSSRLYLCQSIRDSSSARFHLSHDVDLPQRVERVTGFAVTLCVLKFDSTYFVAFSTNCAAAGSGQASRYFRIIALFHGCFPLA